MKELSVFFGLLLAATTNGCSASRSADSAAAAASAVHAQSDSPRSPVGSGGQARSDKSMSRGNLFSAITFADHAFGVEWSQLRVEAQALFPELKLTMVEDLHITVVYIGGDWKPGDLDRIRARALVVPTIPIYFTPEVVRMGRNNQVVVVELHSTSTVWADSVVAAKSALNQLGLKKPESYDPNFRPHITLAQARNNPPTQADSIGLAKFMSWMSSKVAKNPQKFAVTVGPTTDVRLLLAGTARPDGAPEYVAVEDFLKQEVQVPREK